MATHETGTRQGWIAARLELLEAEKELTRRSDELAQRRQELPWVRIDKQYRLETDEGSAWLADLFRGRSQLLVYHFMFGPDYTAGCPSCSSIADGFNSIAIHLANHDVMLWAISRAPLQKLQEYKRRMGWAFPWASSFGGDFNSDFSVSFTEEQQREKGIEYNYRREKVFLSHLEQEGGGAGSHAAMCGTDKATYLRDRPGVSAFALEDGVVYHTYPPMGEDWTASGACTNSSTVPPRAATRPAPGGAGTTSTVHRTAWVDAATREVLNDRRVLRGRASAAPPRPPAIQGHGFGPTRGIADASAEMPSMPRGVADCCHGRQFLGSRRRLGARKCGAVMGWSAGSYDLAASVRTSARASSAIALKCAFGGRQ